MLKLVPNCCSKRRVDERSPWFVEIDGRLYPTINHPDGQSPSPWYRICGQEIYPDRGHPCGAGLLPWFLIQGDKITSLPANIENDSEHLQQFRVVR